MGSTNINTQLLQNVSALDRNNQLLGRSLTRLSSGVRMVAASDDAAGAGLSEKISAQNRRVSAAQNNVQNALSQVQSVDGFLDGMGRIASRMSELCILATDPLKNAADKALYATEFSQMQDQLRNTIGGSTAEIGGTFAITKPFGMFNRRELFGANPAGTVVTTGHYYTQRLTIPETNLRDGAMVALFVQDGAGVYTMSVTDTDAVQKITAATTDLGNERAKLGAIASRLDLAAGALVTEGENLTAAFSGIVDVDVAAETTRLTKFQMLTQGGTAMLAQANQGSRSILKLLA